MLNLISQLKLLSDQANDLLRQSKSSDKGYIVFFETRSFWLVVVGVVFTLANTFGIDLGIEQSDASSVVINIISIVPFAWALIERILGKKTVVWSSTQAQGAVSTATEAATAAVNDKASEALVDIIGTIKDKVNK